MLAQDMGIRGISGQGMETNEQWRQIIAQVEASLCRSDVYRQALDQLQQMAADNGTSTQFLLKSVIRETIRLAVKTVLLAGETSTGETAGVELKALTQSQALDSSEPLTPAEQAALEDEKTFASIAQVMQPTDQPTRPKKRSRKPTAEELAQQAAIARIERLQKVCAKIKQTREAQGLSLHHLHARTFIPLYHLQALDAGQIEHLPVDIYLRGFLHRLEKALGLPEQSLTEAIPLPEPTTLGARTAKAPYAAGSSNFGVPLQSLPVYLTYGAVVAGGLFWLSNQSKPQTALTPIQIDLPKENPVPQAPSQKDTNTQVKQAKTQLTQKIAAPEMR
ncbi:MAG: helix-turn-helix transcriptional regulator [Synechococcales bacterium]|nr:helix-turn-helix transcriptional regulator [Synechococcales bacterium]